LDLFGGAGVTAHGVLHWRWGRAPAGGGAGARRCVGVSGVGWPVGP
jgi:hypothetical protein